MIIDLPRFIAEERPFWNELEQLLDRLERNPSARLDRDRVRRFHYLYERAAAGLARVATFAAEPDLHRYLEVLVARAYGEIHETRRRGAGLNFAKWFTATFPRTFRRHVALFRLSCAVFLAGSLFGAVALALDPPSKRVFLGDFGHLTGDPSKRVADEESSADGSSARHLSGKHGRFSTMLMTHNTRVSITTMALGMTYGIGTVIMEFYNGVVLGAVAYDYVQAGQSVFLLGWLLPHGAVEIPSILIAGQAGLLIAVTLIGRRSRLPLAARFRAVGPDLVTLIAGVGLMLVWAGCVESFLSQYHEPLIPYAAKIGLGVVELVVLRLYLTRAGRTPEEGTDRER